MRTKSGTVIASSFCFVAGLVAGYLLLGPAKPDVERGRQSGVLATHEMSRSNPMPDAASETSTLTSDRADAPPVHEEDPREESRDVESRETIEGRAVAADTRAPIAGVIVRAIPVGRDVYVDEGLSPIENARAMLASRRWVRSKTRESRTGEDGRYRLVHLLDGVQYRITANADAWWLRQVQPEAHARAGARIDFDGTRASSVEVDVRVADGEPLPDQVIVVFSNEGRNSSMHWSPDRRRHPVEAARYEVSAYAEGGYRSRMQLVEIGQQPLDGPILIELSRPRGIVGTARKYKNMDHSSSINEVLCARADRDFDEIIDSGTALRTRLQSDRFQFLGLEPGRYRLALLIPTGHTPPVEVTVGRGVTEVELESPPLPAGDLTVRVYEGENVVLREDALNLQFTVQLAPDARRSEGMHYWPLSDGTFALAFTKQAREALAGATVYYLKATIDRLGVRTVPVTAGAKDPIEIRFGARAMLYVELEGFEYGEFQQLYVQLQPISDSGLFKSFSGGTAAQPDSNGIALFPSYEAGNHLLVLQGMKHLFGDRMYSGRLGAWPITLEPGLNDIRLPMPAIHRVVLRRPATSRGQLQMWMRPDRELVYSDAPESGFVELWLPEGQYFVDGHDSAAWVEVTGDTDVILEPMSRDRWHVTITDAGGRLARAGVRTGDQILAVSNEALPGDRERASVLQARMQLGDEVIALTILREDRTLELELPVRERGSDESLGAYLEHTFPPPD